MANLCLMPQKGISEESAVLTEWFVNIGDTVNIGDKLFGIETGKSTFDVESEFAGTLLAVYAQPGDEKLIQAPVCAIGKTGEVVELPTEASEPAQEVPKDFQVPSSKVKVFSSDQREANENFISPRAKALANKAGVDYTQISPTGPENRVIERDVNTYLSNNAPRFESAQTKHENAYSDTPLSPVRKVIAENMKKSLALSAQLTLNLSFDATAVLELRKQFKATEKLNGITIGDIILFAVSRTLTRFPDFNAHLNGDILRRFHNVNLAFACDTPKGLLVPVIFNANHLSLSEISAEVKFLSEQAIKGSIASNLLSGGSFTISNLGAFGIESFTPVINPPQTGILGVCGLKPALKADGKVYQSMGLSLTFDHCANDGAPAAKFLKAICSDLENIFTLLV